MHKHYQPGSGKMFDYLPHIFEFARIHRGSREKVMLTYEEYLVYLKTWENLTEEHRKMYSAK